MVIYPDYLHISSFVAPFASVKCRIALFGLVLISCGVNSCIALHSLTCWLLSKSHRYKSNLEPSPNNSGLKEH